LRVSWTGWQEDGQSYYILCSQPEPVKSVLQVYLGHIHQATTVVRLVDMVEDAVESAAKLHGFIGGQRDCVVVDAVEAVVGDHTMPSATLGDETERTEPQIRIIV